MNRIPQKILLFDIDGTLLLTGGIGKVAIEKTIEDLFGIPECWGNLIPDGKTDPLIFDEIGLRCLKRRITPEELEKIYKRYTGYFEEGIDHSPRFRLMKGVPSLIKHLKNDGNFVLGIQTGNIESVAWAKLRRGQLDSFFDFGGFGSDSSVRIEIVQQALKQAESRLGHSIEKQAVFVIGDAMQDIQAGNALGLRTIAVASNRASVADLKKENPSFVLESLEDIKAFLRCVV